VCAAATACRYPSPAMVPVWALPLCWYATTRASAGDKVTSVYSFNFKSWLLSLLVVLRSAGRLVMSSLNMPVRFLVSWTTVRDSVASCRAK
jgi:hypothetical protein